MRKIYLAIIAGLICNLSNLVAQQWIMSNIISDNEELNIVEIGVDDENAVYMALTFTNSVTIFDSIFVSSGMQDGALVKFNAQGGFEWANQIKSVDNVDLRDVIFEPVSKAIFVGGNHSNNAVYFTPVDSASATSSFQDIFIAKYDKNGNYIQHTESKNSNIELFYNFDVCQGHLFISGVFGNTLDIQGNTLTMKTAFVNPFIVKFDQDLVWQNGFNFETSNFYHQNIFVKSICNKIVISNQFKQGSVILPGIDTVYQPEDIYSSCIIKTDLDLNPLGIREIDGNNATYIRSLSYDGKDGLYAGGFSKGTNLVADSTDQLKADTLVRSYTGDDAFLVKYDTALNFQWARNYGSILPDVGWEVGADSTSSYIAGHFTDKITFGEETINTNGTIDRGLFLGRVDKTGNALGAITAEALNNFNDAAEHMILDTNGYPVIAGYFQSPSIAFGDSVYTNTSGTKDIFFAKACPIIGLNASIQDVVCAGAKTGTINVEVLGNEGPYSYKWSNGDTTMNIDSLAAGDYTLTVTYASGQCTKFRAFTVAEVAPIVEDSVKFMDVTSCTPSDGKILIYPSGGNGDYEYSIDNGQTFQQDSAFTGVIAGIYQVVVRDSAGCEMTGTMDTIKLSGIDLDIDTVITVAASCYNSGDGQIHISASGAGGSYEYSVDGGSNYQADSNFSSLAVGNYKVAVKDVASGCEILDNDTYIINQPDSIEITDTVITRLTCYNQNTGTIIVSAQGGAGDLTYNLYDEGTALLSNASGVFISLKASDLYEVRVTDTNDCGPTVAANLVVTQPAELTASYTVDTVTTIGGNDGAITISAQGGITPYTYSIDGGTEQSSNQFTGLTAGSYDVAVDDSNNCGPVNLNNITVTEPLPDAVNELLMQTAVFPNPSTGIVTISTKGLAGETMNIQILNLSGQVVHETSANNHVIELDLGHVAKGVYLVKMNNITLNDRLVIE